MGVVSCFIHVGYTARSKCTGGSFSLPFSTPLTDGGLPDITHSVRRPLILYIAAAARALLFIYLLSKSRHNFLSIKKVSIRLRMQTILNPKSELLPKKLKKRAVQAKSPCFKDSLYWPWMPPHPFAGEWQEEEEEEEDWRQWPNG